MGRWAPFSQKQDLVERALVNFFPSENNYPKLIYQAMRYALFSGGKRFRPVLSLFVYESFKKDFKRILPTACALEYIHTYSLIHDDLPAIDNDSLRRGKLTCHLKFGEDVAILVGDALFAEAFHLIALAQEGDAATKLRVIGELAEVSGARGMVGGQIVDIESTGKKIDSKTLNYIHTYKTAKLIAASARVGGILAGASGSQLEIILEYAYHLGLAFQITDDILDVVGETACLGKAVGSDQRLKKVTFPSFYGVEKAKELAKINTNKAKKALGKLALDVVALSKLADIVYERQN